MFGSNIDKESKHFHISYSIGLSSYEVSNVRRLLGKAVGRRMGDVGRGDTQKMGDV